MYTFGFIGVGNMGGALARAVCCKCPPERVLLSNRTAAKAEALARELGCAAADNEAVARSCKYIFLGVKPQMLGELLPRFAPIWKERLSRGERFALVSMAAGTSMRTLASLCGVSLPVIRIMPNTPVSVGAGMVLYTANSLTTKSELAEFTSALELAGETDEISEEERDAASVISGCAPALVFMFVKALADAGVRIGLDEKKSLFYAGQTLLGAAKLAIETGKAPDQLKTEVCSPGGTTIEGVKSLAADGLEKVVSRAVSASYQRTLELAGKKS